MHTDSIALNIPETGKPRIIIIGGGFGGMAAIKQLKNKGFQVVLFDKYNYNVFQPLLYQVATAAIHPDSIAAPFRKEMNDFVDFHFRMLEVLSIDTNLQLVTTIAGVLKYDYLLIASGSKSNYFGNEKIERHAFPLKTLSDSLRLRDHLLKIFEQAAINTDMRLQESLLHIFIAGGGPIGVEMAGALAELRKFILPKDYPGIDFSRMRIYLVECADRLLTSMSLKAGNKAKKDLEKMGVIIRLNSMVQSYDGAVVALNNDEKINTSTVIWAAGVRATTIKGIDPACIENGKIKVDEYCRVIGSNSVFAIGDMALLKTSKFPEGLPAVAQPAIQMGRYIGRNLERFHRHASVNKFSYFDEGSLAIIGRAKAVADLPGNLKFSGRIAWYIWLYVHISYLVSFRNKLLVFTNWCWNFFTHDKGHRLILNAWFSNEQHQVPKPFPEQGNARVKKDHLHLKNRVSYVQDTDLVV